MRVQPRNIVRKLNTNEVFEVLMVSGKVLLCNPVNSKGHDGIPVPLKIDEVEVLMEEETDVFNLLFRDNSDE